MSPNGTKVSIPLVAILALILVLIATAFAYNRADIGELRKTKADLSVMKMLDDDIQDIRAMVRDLWNRSCREDK